MPASPVQSWRKFSAVLGTTSARSSKTRRPAGLSPMATSKKTKGFFLACVLKSDWKALGLRAPAEATRIVNVCSILTLDLLVESVAWKPGLDRAKPVKYLQDL